jgi:hypothetical protein
MRKLALLFAAALLVSVPLAATTSTDSYAAAKAKAKAAPKAGAKETKASPEESNTAFFRAVGDLGNSLGQPNTGAPKAAKGGKKGGKKAAKRGGKGKGKKA